jgi:low affinity Fe/Cu permease
MTPALALIIVAILLWLMNSDHLGLPAKWKLYINRIAAIILLLWLVLGLIKGKTPSYY